MDIKNISGIKEVLNIFKANKNKNIDKASKVKKSDSVEISREAKRSAEVKKYINIVKNTSDIRQDKIKMAKEKIKNGDYFKPEVYEKIAEKLTKKFTIGDKILDSLGDDKDGK
ncbi:MAG: flagellar biosynthesis anti-sigma factor FlgM [Spirochaetes bacterium]|nr:flagellar biosynthesis anti-sigma factor FlgM [Spirochaetota bacterium]